MCRARRWKLAGCRAVGTGMSRPEHTGQRIHDGMTGRKVTQALITK